MSKKQSNNSIAEISYMGGSIFDDMNFSHLEGRLLTIIESIGLNPNQEKAVKDLVRGEVWSTFNNGQYITGEQRAKVIEDNRQLGQTPRI